MVKEVVKMVESKFEIEFFDVEIFNIVLYFVNVEVDSDMNDVIYIM